MSGISRYEKIALAATAVFVLFCAAAVLVLQIPSQPYRISAAPAQIQTTGVQQDGTPDSLLPGEKINLNTAPAEDLERLPGIGEQRAQDIVDWREEFGAFESLEDITKVPGIGAGTFSGMKDYITIDEE